MPKLIAAVKSSCDEALRELKQWMRPEKGQNFNDSLSFFSRNCVRASGSCVVIGAIAAGNAVTALLLELLRELFLKRLHCLSRSGTRYSTQVTVRRIIAGKWQLNNGQACISVDYIITTKDFAPKLINALRNGIEEFFGADPFESKYISRIVSSNHFSRLERLLDEYKVIHKTKHDLSFYCRKIAPTIFLDVPEDSQLMQEEIFGPLLPIITVENVKDSIDLINSKPKPLVAYLFTDNQKLRNDFVKNVPTEGMVINDTVLHVTVSNLPFGGVGESGMGSYHGKHSFDAFSHKKAVLYRSFSGDSPVRYPPYPPRK
ncbi:hypothetical protein OIU76_002711 [Salix suchowensis]|nr:hypothetical protein OIU76_002711 [Salix suchowensis]